MVYPPLTLNTLDGPSRVTRQRNAPASSILRQQCIGLLHNSPLSSHYPCSDIRGAGSMGGTYNVRDGRLHYM